MHMHIQAERERERETVERREGGRNKQMVNINSLQYLENGWAKVNILSACLVYDENVKNA